jgi:hypothetical protein
MGCCAQSQVTDFARVENKSQLKQSFNNEINRIKNLKQTMSINPKKPEEETKLKILDSILHEHCWTILLLIEALIEDHVVKIKFILADYFKVTESWNKQDFEENYIKLMNFKKDHNINCEVLLKNEINID